MAHRRTSLCSWRAALFAANVLALPGCELLLDELLPPPPVSCEDLCVVEDECGLRSYSACIAESCDADGGRLNSGNADECMLAVENCADVALCTCDDSCFKLDECTGSPDPSCAETCESLVEQDVVGTFQENRCRIESTCDELPTCGGA